MQIPSGGNALVNHMLATVLGLVYDTHQLIGEAIREHGLKLQTASSMARKADIRDADLIYDFLGTGSFNGGSSSLPVDPYPLPSDGTIPDYLGIINGVSAFRPMPARYATPRISASPVLPGNLLRLVGGDPDSLIRLAQEIFGYVKGQGNSSFSFLWNTVKQLVVDDDGSEGCHPDHGGWCGLAAYTFRNAFITDAATMNGLHCTMCAIAGILQDFAAELARAEHGVEETILAMKPSTQPLAGVSDGEFLGYFTSYRLHGSQVLRGNGPAINNSATALANVTLDMANLRQATKPFFDAAERARHTAASRLAAQGEVLLSGVAFYEAHSTNTGEGPGAFITSYQYGIATGDHGAQNPKLADLSQNLAKYDAQLNLRNSDIGTIKKDLKDLGVVAGDANSIAGDMKNFKRAEDAAKKASGIAGLMKDVLPLIAEIGLGVAVTA